MAKGKIPLGASWALGVAGWVFQGPERAEEGGAHGGEPHDGGGAHVTRTPISHHEAPTSREEGTGSAGTDPRKTDTSKTARNEAAQIDSTLEMRIELKAGSVVVAGNAYADHSDVRCVAQDKIEEGRVKIREELLSLQ